jgi:hypothetical protein
MLYIMTKTKLLTIRVTEQQDRILEAKANSMGFRNKSEFARAIMFLDKDIFAKISEMHEVIMDGRTKT